LAGATASYYNYAYKSLIKRDDLYICTAFDRMHSAKQHSYVCLLNILYMMTMNINAAIDRSHLDLTDLSAYQRSIEAALQPLLDNVRPTLIDKVNHDCRGIDIATCDPNEDLFCQQESWATSVAALN
jgi:hypothetical protein